MADCREASGCPEVAENLTKVLVNIATESWRFGKVIERMLYKIAPDEQARYLNQYRWYKKQIEEAFRQADLRIVNIEGHLFDPGMAATPVNIDEFDSGDILLVDQMLEPIIMANERLLRAGTVLLRRAES